MLWYKFLFGDDEALKTLVAYNFHDVAGMTYILDDVFFRDIYGKEFLPERTVKRFYDEGVGYSFRTGKKTMESIRKEANAKNFDMSLLRDSPTRRIVGIDLAGVVSKSSHTGICLLEGDRATVTTVGDDEEIIRFIEQVKAEVVSIDAPLSMPKGRTSVYNDDPMHEEAGIERYCEKVLHGRGVNSYPALIDSMQELTKRGIGLSQKLRKRGYPVIECFPGAAQDILQLPRKKTDVQLLKTGLTRLGIHGDYEGRKVCHDELDAITAAIVGMFFIDGYYEPIGIPEENDMIVPCVTRRRPDFDIVVGFAGRIGAGKTTAARHLEDLGYAYCRYSQVIADILQEKGIEATREAMQDEGEKIFESGQYGLNQKVEARLAGNRRVAIDGMRHLEDDTYWKEKCFLEFRLVYIDANESECAKRKQLGLEEYRAMSGHQDEQETADLRSYADVVIENNGSFEGFYEKLDALLENI